MSNRPQDRVEILPAANLADLATEIGIEHAAAHQAARTAIDHALRCGELLLEAKAQVPHGKWEKWLKKSTELNLRTARAYMQIAALDAEKRQRVADLPMREALKAIAQHKHLPAEERQQVIREENRRKYNEWCVKQGYPERDWPPLARVEGPPEPPPPPLTPAQIADNIVSQLDLVVHESGGEITHDDMEAAVRRRFGEEPKSFDYQTLAEQEKADFEAAVKEISAMFSMLTRQEILRIRELQEQTQSSSLLEMAFERAATERALEPETKMCLQCGKTGLAADDRPCEREDCWRRGDS